VVENFVIKHPQAGLKEIAVYCLLAARCHMPKKWCRASISSLAKQGHVERNTVNKALDNLISGARRTRPWRRIHLELTAPASQQAQKATGSLNSGSDAIIHTASSEVVSIIRGGTLPLSIRSPELHRYLPR